MVKIIFASCACSSQKCVTQTADSPEPLDRCSITVCNLWFGSNVERVPYIPHLFPPVAGLVVIAKELLLPAERLW